MRLWIIIGALIGAALSATGWVLSIWGNIWFASSFSGMNDPIDLMILVGLLLLTSIGIFLLMDYWFPRMLGREERKGL